MPKEDKKEREILAHNKKLIQAMILIEVLAYIKLLQNTTTISY
jgi:hypothetical protein